MRDFAPNVLTPAQTQEWAEQVGVKKVAQPLHTTIILGVLAGMFISLGGAMLGLVNTSGTALPFPVKAAFGGLVFCLGLILVILAGGELFTGNVLLVQAASSKKISWRSYAKNLVIVWLSNFAGSILFVAIAFFANLYTLNTGGAAGTLPWGDAIATVAKAKTSLTFDVIFFKGIICNFLVCLAVWMSFAGKSLADKFLAIIFPVTAFVALGTEHVVANMFLLPMAYILKLTGHISQEIDTSSVDILPILSNLGAATLGNLVGGAILVGVLYWLAYAKRSNSN